MGNELPLVKSATSTLYREPAFLNTTAFSLVTKSGASTTPRDLHTGLSYRASGGLLAGVPGGWAALSITPYMNRAGYYR
jgi:hypothetical protein